MVGSPIHSRNVDHEKSIVNADLSMCNVVKMPETTLSRFHFCLLNPITFRVLVDLYFQKEKKPDLHRSEPINNLFISDQKLWCTVTN